MLATDPPVRSGRLGGELLGVCLRVCGVRVWSKELGQVVSSLDLAQLAFVSADDERAGGTN